MSTIPAFQSGLSGIHKGLQSLDNNAAKIASAETFQSGADVTKPLVNMISDKLHVQASAKVIETSNAMLGSILDIKV
jgi:flagellar hook protein FlgE